MHAANGLPHGEAATPEQPKHTSYLAAITPPRQRENAATRSRAIPVAAAPPRCCRGGRSDGRRPPCATLSTCTRFLRARIGRSREAATLLHVAVPLCSETQTSEVWIASSPMRTGGRPMCSGASSFMWEAAAQHFQVVGAL